MHAYPQEVIRVMRPQMAQILRTIRHHFKRRHDGRGSKCARDWIEAYRELDRSSGYSEAVAQITQAS